MRGLSPLLTLNEEQTVMFVALTYRISKGEVITLSSKDGIQTSLAVSVVWTGHHQCQHTYQHKDCHLHRTEA